MYELLEDMFRLISWDANTCVLYDEAHFAIRQLRLESDAAFIGELHGVLEQMSQNARGLHFVGKQRIGIGLRIDEPLE